jgi:hypothetical protein
MCKGVDRSDQTLVGRDLKDVWEIRAYPNMKTGETLKSLIDNFVFETEQLAKEEVQRALEQDHDQAFWGFTFVRKSLVLQKEGILPMSAFRKKILATMTNTHERDAVTDEDIAGLYADYFKSGKTFEEWKKEHEQ